MATAHELFERGQLIRRRLGGGSPVRSSAPTSEQLTPDLQVLITEACFGGVWARPALETRQHMLVTLSCLTALGRTPQLRGHLRNSLNLGFTPEELLEVFIHLVFYVGLPSSLNAITVAGEVFEDRDIHFTPPRVEDPDDLEVRLQRGKEMRQRIWGPAAEEGRGAVKELLPDMETLVTQYLFGTIYYRPGLDLQSRSICTMSALTALGRLPQLKRHIQGALGVGLTKEQIAEVFFQTMFYAGLPAAINAMTIAKEVFDSQG